MQEDVLGLPSPVAAGFYPVRASLAYRTGDWPWALRPQALEARRIGTGGRKRYGQGGRGNLCWHSGRRDVAARGEADLAEGQRRAGDGR